MLHPLLITGAKGKLGQELGKIFPDGILAGRGDFDITDRGAVMKFIKEAKPAAIIHAAALTDVVKCEHEKELAWNINVVGTENFVESVLSCVPDAYFVYVSSACVFKGDTGPYKESDIPEPVNFYGLTKLIGEFIAKRIKNSLVIRTNFVPRGPWRHAKAFVDRWGTYLFADDVARGIKDVMERNFKGIVHICGSEKMSMFELARSISPEIQPFTLSEFASISDVHLTRDMTLCSERISAYKITRQ